MLARHGTAYTASSPGKLEGLSQLAVLIDLETSSDGLGAFGKIFSYSIRQTQMNFIFGQWKDAFLPIVRTDQRVQGIKLGVEGALQQGERTKFLLNWDGRRIRLYQDGATINARETGASAFSNWSKEYPLIAGTDANGRAQWRGTLYEVAIFDRALSPQELKSLSGRKDKKSKSEIAAHPAGARNDSQEQDNRPLIHYVFGLENTYETEFRGGKALGVRDLGKGEPADLVIPEQFEPYKRICLGWDPDWLDYKSNWLDLAVNVLGFVPFGLLLVFAFRKVTGDRRQATGDGMKEEIPPVSPFMKGGGLEGGPLAKGGSVKGEIAEQPSAARNDMQQIVIAVILAVVAGLVVSFAIEYLQAYLPSRDSSVRDLIANATGTLIGTLAAVWLVSRRKSPLCQALYVVC